MELKTIIMFVLAVAWFFIKNFEGKPRNMPSTPSPEPVPEPLTVGQRRQNQRKMTGGRPSTPKNFSTKNAPVQAAFPMPGRSLEQKGGPGTEILFNDSNDREVNEFADELGTKLRSPEGAREAFIYSEIFNRRV